MISAFGEHFVKTNILPAEMGRELKRAFEKRQLSDYGIKSVISKVEAEELLKNGKKFVENVSRYLHIQEKSQEKVLRKDLSGGHGFEL